MIGLCLVLYTIVVSRMESSTNVIFGGAEGAYVKSDSVTFVDMNATPTPEPTVDIWPQLTQSDFEANNYLRMVNNDNLISSAFEPDSIARISSTRYMMFDAEYLPYLDAFIEEEHQPTCLEDDAPCTMEERIMLGLRLTEGIPVSWLSQRQMQLADRFCKGGLMKQDSGRIRFTPEGFLVSNGVLAELL